MRSIVLLFFFCGIFFRIHAQVTLVPLSEELGETNEPSIAIDPKYPFLQLLGTNVDKVFISSNYGYNWEEVKTNQSGGFYGDPVCYIDPSGKMYVLHLAKNPSKQWPDWFDKMVLDYSEDEGKTWKSTTFGYSEGKMQDKPWLNMDESKKSDYKGNIYVTWTQFDQYGSRNKQDSSRIRLAYSADSGKTFVDSVVVSDQSGDCHDGDSTAEGATAAMGKNGEVYVVWARENKIYFDVSFDGGKTFGKDKVIANQPGGWVHDIKGVMRTNGLPFIVSDKAGALYVTWSDFSNNKDADVWVIYSKDGGNTWSPKVKVSRESAEQAGHQFMPHISTDKKTGKVYIIYYDRRNSENNLYTDVYVAEFFKGKFKREIRLTENSFFPPGSTEFFGDYIGVAAAKGWISGAFTYVNQNGFATVAVGMVNKKSIKNAVKNKPAPYLLAHSSAEENSVFMHFYFPENSALTLKITKAGQTVFQQLLQGSEELEKEIKLPLNKFPSGIYEIELKSESNVIRTEFFLERAKP